ncbi:MAG: hypothetical protein DWI30_01205 [Chloroflexi bacterium]|nr:MAG: hypothetical protein DWI30_01205 [Chloroflexota bacterium]
MRTTNPQSVVDMRVTSSMRAEQARKTDSIRHTGVMPRDTGSMRHTGALRETTRATGSMRHTGTHRTTSSITTRVPTTPLIYSQDDDLYATHGEEPSLILTAGTNLVWIVLICVIIWLGISIAQHQSGSETTILSSYYQSTNLRAAAKVIGITLPEIPRIDNTPKVEIPSGESSVLGPPTITAQRIDEILRVHGSPATGTGQYWIDAGLEYGIDPVYALAFFMHESTLGTNPAWSGFKPDGSSTHNIGNITCAGYPTCYGRFRDYPDWQTGIRDWFRLIAVEYIADWGLATVESIIPRYAPQEDNNDEPLYINSVKLFVAQWRQP